MSKCVGLAVALALMVASAASAQITIGAPSSENPNKRSIRFTEYHAINTITEEIDSCYRMWFVWDRGTAGAVSAYAVEPADDTFAEVEAGTLIRAFTTDETYGPITPGDSQVRFVVDTEETAGNSTMTVHCSNDLASGGGGGGSGAPPASGVDSVITVFENGDYDGDTTVVKLDAATDMLRSNVNHVSEMGFPTDRIYMAAVNDNTVATVQGYVKWFSGFGTTSGADSQRLSERADILNVWSAVTPGFAGRLQGKALGVAVRGDNTATTQSCRVSVHRNTAMAAGPAYPALVPTATGAATNWTECTGAIEFGPAATNAGGIGSSGVVDDSGERYMVPLSDCLCDIDECVLVVAVEDRDEGGGETCTDINDVDFTFAVGEVIN